MYNIRYRLALCGFGQVARYQLEALSSRQDLFELVAVCDADSTKLSAVGIPTYTDLASMLSREHPEVALISVPYAAHYETARIALESDVSVLVEKPATATLDEFQILREISRSRGLLLHTAFHAAYAPELRWYLDRASSFESRHGPVTGIACGFYDPYISGGSLAAPAFSLGGSWVDSGINELSVAAQLVSELRVESIRRTVISEIPAREIQGTAWITFTVGGISQAGQGFLDTNWTLGFSRKQTELFFGGTGSRILIDHTARRVVLRAENSAPQLLVDLTRGVPSRLTSHYLGVFADLYEALNTHRDNSAASQTLLEHLYADSPA